MEVVKIKTKDVARREGEIIKPIEIISIEGMEDWSLVDRRTWNLLLLNAWSDRLEDPTADFTIPLRELRGLHDSNDRIWETLKRLQTTLVEARLPDGSLQCVQMLGSTNLKDKGREEGYLKYDFHRKLVPILRNSEIYARMEMKVITAFTSKYSLALYEALAARIELRKSLEIMSVADLRRWFGVEKKKLSTWSNFLKFAIQPALLEVNALSPFLIEIEPIKHGRSGIVKSAVGSSRRSDHAFNNNKFHVRRSTSDQSSIPSIEMISIGFIISPSRRATSLVLIFTTSISVAINTFKTFCQAVYTAQKLRIHRPKTTDRTAQKLRIHRPKTTL